MCCFMFGLLFFGVWYGEIVSEECLYDRRNNVGWWWYWLVVRVGLEIKKKLL